MLLVNVAVFLRLRLYLRYSQVVVVCSSGIRLSDLVVWLLGSGWVVESFASWLEESSDV